MTTSLSLATLGDIDPGIARPSYQRSDLSPGAYAEFALDWVQAGATIVGGCCEVGPDHIRALAGALRAAGHKIV